LPGRASRPTGGDWVSGSGAPAGEAALSIEHEQHLRPTLLSDFILGSQDGIVNVLGIILGLVAAHTPRPIILIAALSALAAESIAMAAVAYSSTLSRRHLYLAEVEREKREMREVPDVERGEVREILSSWGYQGADLEDMTDRICRNPKAMLELMMGFELKLAPVEERAPRVSAYIVGTATVVGHIVPLLPFFLLTNILDGAVLAVLLSAITLFLIGWYEAKTTIGAWWKNGLRMTVIGLVGGFAGFLIGHFIPMIPGL
jgi:vacuolar iron transporter family protein